MQFGKIFDPISSRSKKIEEDDRIEENQNYVAQRNEVINSDIPWKDEEDRISNFYITGNPDYDKVPLPKIIKIKDPLPGEVAIFVKRNSPKIARIHKKKQDNDPHRYFLSELMLYTSYTD